MTEAFDIALSIGGFLASVRYVLRMNALDRSVHRPQCIAVQSVGFLSGCWIAGSSFGAGGAWQWLNFCTLCILLVHLGVTSIRWPSNNPPPEAESRPMPLDGIRQ